VVPSPPLTPPISFDRVARIYDASRALPPELQAELTVHLASRLRGGRTLDIGAGTGRLSIPLQTEHGLDVVAADVSAGMLAEGRRRGLHRIVRADVRRLPFRTASFDRSLATHLLHLVPEWPLALEEIVRVTRSELLSVLKQERETPSLHEEYSALAKESGIDTAAPGIPERRFAERYPPDRREPVGGFRVSEPATAVLQRLRDRLYRDQWDVPTPVHRKILKTLRDRHRDDEVVLSASVEIGSWEIGRLAAALPRPGTAHERGPTRPS